MTPTGSGDPAPAPSRFRLSLTQQIVVGLIVGCLVGWWAHGLPAATAAKWNEWLALGRDIFLHLIKAMIAPLIFASIVQGIAGTGDLKKVGRIGAKTLIYFEVTTVFALAVALTLVNLLGPGRGMVLEMGNTSALGEAVHNKPLTLVQQILHIFPTSFFEAAAHNDVLQIVCFAVIFATAVTAAGEAGRPVLNWCASLTQVMFKFAAVIMKFAPVGVGAAIAVTVGHQGLGVLLHLGQLVLTLYLALVAFVVLGMGAVIWLARVPLKAFVRAVRAPFTLAFATANSEAALPDAFANMERLGVPRGIVGFVLPAGYTFNLDGSTLYLAVASVFIAQAAETSSHTHFGLGAQLVMVGTLMITSKGVAAVPRASLVVLLSTLASFNLPLEGAAMILGVDALMDMARTSVNVLGNCLASVVVARWENEFDDAKAEAEFGSGS